MVIWGIFSFWLDLMRQDIKGMGRYLEGKDLIGIIQLEKVICKFQ